MVSLGTLTLTLHSTANDNAGPLYLLAHRLKLNDLKDQAEPVMLTTTRLMRPTEHLETLGIEASLVLVRPICHRTRDPERRLIFSTAPKTSASHI